MAERDFRRGDFWLADLGPDIGPHPCILLSRDAAIIQRRRAIVAIVTSRPRGTRTEVAVGPEDGLDRDCVIDANELITLDTDLLVRRMGSLTPAKQAALVEALRVALALPRIERDENFARGL